MPKAVLTDSLSEHTAARTKRHFSVETRKELVEYVTFAGRMKRILLVIALLAATLTAAAKGKTFVLCIDPGHGGHDAGAVGQKAKEKDINLSVALAFGKLVEQKCRDVKVVYTRTTDVFITLQGRADIANAAHADLFISIHTNSVPDGRWAYGSETYALGKNSLGTNYSVVTSLGRVTAIKGGKAKQEAYNSGSAESAIAFDLLHAEGLEQGALLAQCIQRWYAKAGRVDKGVKEGVWLVLRRTAMPAVLTELGFVSTPDEEEYLTSKGGVQTLANCLYNGFIDYRNALDHQKRKHIDLNAASSPRPRPNPTAQQNTPPQTPPAQTQQQPRQQQQAPARTQQQQRQTPQQPRQNNRQQAACPKVCFRVQILSSSREIPSGDTRLKGVSAVYCYQEGGMFKYTTGEFDTAAAARKHKDSLADKFPGAFIVAFIDGKRVSVQEAQEALKQ